VFVLTHHAREPVEKEAGTTFTFVTDGIESALEQAREAAGDRDVAVGGGAEVVQQYLEAGLIDEMQLHVVPLLLGGGVRLFDGRLPDSPRALEFTRVIESPTGVAHLQYRAAG
jgi:dihydrofolate reductase